LALRQVLPRQLPELCREHGSDYYDASLHPGRCLAGDPRRPRRHEVFYEHRDHVATVRADAAEPSLGLANFCASTRRARRSPARDLFQLPARQPPFSFLKIEGRRSRSCARARAWHAESTPRSSLVLILRRSRARRVFQSAGKANCWAHGRAVLETAYRRRSARIPTSKLSWSAAATKTRSAQSRRPPMLEQAMVCSTGGFVQFNDYRNPPWRKPAAGSDISATEAQRRWTQLSADQGLLDAARPRSGGADGTTRISARVSWSGRGCRTSSCSGTASEPRLDRHFKPMEEARKFIKDQRWNQRCGHSGRLWRCSRATGPAG